jgi:hypothetical protein
VVVAVLGAGVSFPGPQPPAEPTNRGTSTSTRGPSATSTSSTTAPEEAPGSTSTTSTTAVPPVPTTTPAPVPPLGGAELPSRPAAEAAGGPGPSGGGLPEAPAAPVAQPVTRPSGGLGQLPRTGPPMDSGLPVGAMVLLLAALRRAGWNRPGRPERAAGPGQGGHRSGCASHEAQPTTKV